MSVVSIITPSFEQAGFLERTILSVLHQDTGPRALDYLVVDGGSRDGTLEILRRYSDRLRWISEPDSGQAQAVNKGIRATSGDIIGWLNSDDVYCDGAVRAACDFLDEQPDVDVVYGDALHIDEHDHVLGPYPTEPWNPARLLETCYLCQPAVFFRRRVVERFGLLDERLQVALDYELWLRLARGGARFAHLPRVLAAWRLYPGIKSYTSRLALHTEVNDIMRERFGRVPDRWIYNYAHALLERSSISSSQHLRFACALALLSAYASIRWNGSLPRSMLDTFLVWLKDGLKLWSASLRTGLRTRLRWSR